MNARTDAGAIAILMQEYQRSAIHRQVVTHPVATRALFVAAHADDVEIGCGGTLMKLLDAQVVLRQVVLTDGRLAAPRPEEEEEMVRVRADEARSVAAHLMQRVPDLLGVSERELFDAKHEQPMIEKLAALLAEVTPDAIFVPWFFDQHPDHRYANHLLARALERRAAAGLDLAKVMVYAYEVWSFVPPRIVVDISDVLAEKKRLVSLYRSQLKLTDYLALVDELAVPRARMAGPRATAAEFFCPFRADTYVARALTLDFTSPQSRAPNIMLAPPG